MAKLARSDGALMEMPTLPRMEVRRPYDLSGCPTDRVAFRTARSGMVDWLSTCAASGMTEAFTKGSFQLARRFVPEAAARLGRWTRGVAAFR